VQQDGQQSGCPSATLPKVVNEHLGHASIGITLDTYSHVMPGMQEEAADKIDAGLRAALAG
jgi:integrase